MRRHSSARGAGLECARPLPGRPFRDSLCSTTAPEGKNIACTAHSIIQNGKAIPFEEASIHPLAVGVAYGAAVFEGIRAYMNPATGRLSVFRLEEHLARPPPTTTE